jgi:hypothetical protein
MSFLLSHRSIVLRGTTLQHISPRFLSAHAEIGVRAGTNVMIRARAAFGVSRYASQGFQSDQGRCQIYAEDEISEDIELGVRIHAAGYKSVLVPVKLATGEVRAAALKDFVAMSSAMGSLGLPHLPLLHVACRVTALVMCKKYGSGNITRHLGPADWHGAVAAGAARAALHVAAAAALAQGRPPLPDREGLRVLQEATPHELLPEVTLLALPHRALCAVLGGALPGLPKVLCCCAHCKRCSTTSMPK